MATGSLQPPESFLAAACPGVAETRCFECAAPSVSDPAAASHLQARRNETTTLLDIPPTNALDGTLHVVSASSLNAEECRSLLDATVNRLGVCSATRFLATSSEGDKTPSYGATVQCKGLALPFLGVLRHLSFALSFSVLGSEESRHLHFPSSLR